MPLNSKTLQQKIPSPSLQTKPPVPPLPKRYKGKVLWYSARKRYGFIVSEDTNEELFLHKGNVLNESELKNGDVVTFIITPPVRKENKSKIAREVQLVQAGNGLKMGEKICENGEKKNGNGENELKSTGFDRIYCFDQVKGENGWEMVRNRNFDFGLMRLWLKLTERFCV